MQSWQELTATALVGTERHAPNFTSAGGALGETLARLDPAEREHAVLGAAGLMALWRRAGYRAKADDLPLPEPCAADEKPACSAAAGGHLALMLGGDNADLLPEWLEAVAAAGKRISEDQLPELLALGQAQIGLRSWIVPVLGRRGRWLAGQNSDWHYAVESDDSKEWESGNRAERLALLNRLREIDPDRAREILSGTWKTEAARDRSAFLASFAVGLGMADEPFLENALDDRGREVRRTAAELLARLADSRLVQRLSARTLPLLSFENARLRVVAPGADPALARDGIEDRPPEAKVGEKAWRLAQLVGVVPPAAWCESLPKTPLEIVRAALSSDWREALLEGWKRAAQRHRDADWSAALLYAWPEGSDDLLEVLPPERFESYVLHTLRERPLAGDHPALAALRRCHHPWSAAFARTVLEQARRCMARHRKADWQLPYQFPQFARYVPPELLDEAAEGWPDDAPYWTHWESALQAFLSVLRFRRDMLAAIAE